MNSGKSLSTEFFEHIAEQVEDHLARQGKTVFFAMFVGDADSPESGTMYWTNAEQFTRESISKELTKSVKHLVDHRCGS